MEAAQGVDRRVFRWPVIKFQGRRWGVSGICTGHFDMGLLIGLVMATHNGIANRNA
jgi:hypothetical protein